MRNKIYVILSVVALLLTFSVPIFAQEIKASQSTIKTLTVTVEMEGKANIPFLDEKDFLVSENGQRQEVISAVAASSGNAPLNLAIVIEEGLPQINREINALKEFVKGLPTGSQVMIAYVQNGRLAVQQPFTSSLTEASEKFRVVPTLMGNYTSPYWGLVESMKMFNGFREGRNEVLFISKGLDPFYGSNSNPSANPAIEQAIAIAERENITVFALYSPRADQLSSVGGRRRFLTVQGQNALIYMAERTGGEAFIGADGYVTFDAPLKEFGKLLDQQYLITYRSSMQTGKYRSIKVKTDYSNVKIRTVKGYNF
ncbi:MAG: VWA domain-containing protein [Blastocatellia bacterium]|nr:VWA domain-containing protein [Blastocatellia bacterium]